jgi:methyltransferase OMS1, mitochondrial
MSWLTNIVGNLLFIYVLKYLVHDIFALSNPCSGTTRKSSYLGSKDSLPVIPIFDDTFHDQRYDDQNVKRRDFFHNMRSRFIAGCTVVTTHSHVTPSSCYALTPKEAQQQYDTYATKYDQIDGGEITSFLGIDTARKLLIGQAHGKVLEVGVGTGLNLPYYSSDRITSLDLVDISDGMLQEARNKVSALPNLQNIPVNFINADMTSQLIERFGAESFDTVIDTFSMCVLGDQGAMQCLDQLRRVVRSDGQLLLLENSRSSNPLLGLYQDTTADIVANIGGRGCLYNQDIEKLIRSNNHLRIVKEQSFSTGLFRSFSCIRNV